MEQTSQKMLVIGAGPTGLAIAKALRAARIPYDQVEADSDLGGNWHHGVYTTAHIISSKKATQYADFPMPKEFPDFPSAEQMMDYLNRYAQIFHVRESITFSTRVLSVSPRTDTFWDVTFDTGEQCIYKGVVICNGHHWDRRWPSYPGTFTGEYIHSKDYRNPEQLRGKRVLVIGGGNSATDIASEAAHVGASCDLSLRQGYWFLPKLICGIPLTDLFPSWMPISLQRLLLRLLLKIMVGDYRSYGLPRPTYRIFDKHPTVNTEPLYYIRAGSITPRPAIEAFEGNRIRFVDGRVGEYDLVVAATGFHLSFPFLPEGLVPVKDNVAQVYGGSLLPTHKHLYVVGAVQPRYGFGPLITPAAALLCRMMKLQEKMQLPLGYVLKEMGQRPPSTELVDPFQTLRQLRRARLFLPLTLRVERRLRRQGAHPEVPTLVPRRPDTLTAVY